MVVLGLVKDLASRESVVNGCMGWANIFCVVFCISATKEPVQLYDFVSGLHLPF